MIFRIAIFGSFVGYNTVTQGVTGLWCSILLFGFLAWVWYMVMDTWQRAIAGLRRPTTVNNNLTITTDAIPGTRIGPDGEEWAAIVENGREHFKNRRD